MSDYFDPSRMNQRAFALSTTVLVLFIVGVSLVVDGVIAVVVGIGAAVLVYDRVALIDRDEDANC